MPRGRIRPWRTDAATLALKRIYSLEASSQLPYSTKGKS